eukprot:7389707-Prymnesium_polylepis.2
MTPSLKWRRESIGMEDLALFPPANFEAGSSEAPTLDAGGTRRGGAAEHERARAGVVLFASTDPYQGRSGTVVLNETTSGR